MLDNDIGNRGKDSRPPMVDLGLWGGSKNKKETDPLGDSPVPRAPVPRPVLGPKSFRQPGPIGYLARYLYIGSLLSLATIVFFIMGFGFPMLQDIIDQLPGLEIVNNYRPNLGSQLLASDGTQLAEFYKEEKRNRLARYEEIPKHLIDALIATEDQQFYEHHGVNPVRIVLAGIGHLTKGQRAGGGSTITQQIAKDLYTNWEKTLDRKIREALYALKIEQELSKEEILTIYFNQVSFGHNKAGIWAAAQGFFGKTPMELDLAECATLVGLLKGNTIYSPIKDPERSKDRRGVVLRQMLDCGFITEQEYEEAASKDFDPAALGQQTGEGPERVNRVPYWRAYFEETLFKSKTAFGGVLPTNDPISELGDDQIYHDGLKIHSTLDLSMQEWGEEAIHKALVDVEKERRKEHPGWGLETEDWPKFPTRIYANATLLGRITGFVEPGWLTVKLVNIHGTPEVAVPHPGPGDWRTKFGVLSPPYMVQVKVHERSEADKKEHREMDLENRGLVSKQELRFELINQYADQHAQGALICLEAGTGKVLAWVGGNNWGEEQAGRQRIRCIEGHQPGSAFKPIVFSDAFGRGYTPATKISNETYVKWLPNGQKWEPRNYEEKTIGGYYPIHTVLVKSLNIPTVRVFETLIGQGYEYDPLTQQVTYGIARRLGIHSPIPKELSAALGTADVTPLELAAAYSVFANKGVLVEPYTVDSIETREGKQAFIHKTAGNPQALDPVTAFLITDILAAVIRTRAGTAYSRANDFPFPIAGKTGTTNLYNDAWFAGYSKNLVTVVWIGHDRRTSLGSKMAGAKVALPPWLEFMKQAIPYHLKEHEGWTSDQIAAAVGSATSTNHSLAFEKPGQGVERMEVCRYSKNRPNAFCQTIWIWARKGEGPREVCKDCGIRYTDEPVVQTAYPLDDSAGAARPRPLQSRRLEPVSPSEPQVDIQETSQGWTLDAPSTSPPTPDGVQPAMPRPVPRVGRKPL